MEPRVHLPSKDSKLKKLTRLFAQKSSTFFGNANVGGKIVKNNAKYISSTTRIPYKKQVLIHAKHFRKPDTVD